MSAQRAEAHLDPIASGNGITFGVAAPACRFRRHWTKLPWFDRDPRPIDDVGSRSDRPFLTFYAHQRSL
ncbi:MAG: hypothetical protein DMF95_13665 [Acidobacteria bacterium]|nr:MAG: hypothetical protein DMF96_03090 [Acidobacteriota bacterium]PYR21888.1 MAG: hypothetical protein DMF94_06475 [Acidobacteriota bacterium]PYR48809.1 MAG: hypothetical protein DMF95_13665 [Acidobacteriota bacterium]